MIQTTETQTTETKDGVCCCCGAPTITTVCPDCYEKSIEPVLWSVANIAIAAGTAYPEEADAIIADATPDQIAAAAVLAKMLRIE